MWNLEGLKVSGMYMNEFPVTGVVELSRVMYGGRVSHHVILTTPIVVYNEIRDRVILEHQFVESVRS